MPVLPLSLIRRPVRPGILPIAMLHSLVELPNIRLNRVALIVQVHHLRSSLQIVVLERSLVYVILSLLDAFLPLSDVLLERTLEVTVLVEVELAHPVLEIVLVTADVVGTVGEGLLPQLCFFAIFPFALVHPVQSPVLVLSVPVRFILAPLAFVVRSVGRDHEPHTVSAVVVEHTDIVESTVVEHDSVAHSDSGTGFAQKYTLVFDGSIQISIDIPISGYFWFQF